MRGKWRHVGEPQTPEAVKGTVTVRDAGLPHRLNAGGQARIRERAEGDRAVGRGGLGRDTSRTGGGWRGGT